MNEDLHKFMVLIGCASILATGSSALGDGVRWDFAGTFSSVSGLGSSQPGVSVGATITGSMTLQNIAGVYVSSSYPYWAGGTTTVFGGAYCSLSYTVTSRGTSYDYLSGVYSLDMQITSNPSDQDNYHFWGGSGTYWFDLGKRGPGIPRAGDFAGFLDGMSGGLGDGSGFVTLAESNWGNSVDGYLTSLTQTIIPVPEPPGLTIIGLGTLLLAARRKKKRFWFRSLAPRPPQARLT